MPPKFQEVQAYFLSKGVSVREAEEFFLLNDKRNWRAKNGNVCKSWKPLAKRWIVGIEANTWSTSDMASAQSSSAKAHGEKSGSGIIK